MSKNEKVAAVLELAKLYKEEQIKKKQQRHEVVNTFCPHCDSPMTHLWGEAFFECLECGWRTNNQPKECENCNPSHYLKYKIDVLLKRRKELQREKLVLEEEEQAILQKKALLSKENQDLFDRLIEED